jgi:cellulose synthase/poly-beta-1,6-N-acetylglucosamine synthase-like glycosyltransferase
VSAVPIVLVVVLLLLVLQALVNTRFLARLDAMPARARSAAVLIPARNEASRIGQAVRAWLTQRDAQVDLWVYDDESTDDTAARARAAANGDRRLRVIAGGPLPADWLGKPHACHRLRAATDADILVFADADAVPAPDALARVLGALAATGADALSVLPRHEDRRVLVRALAGLQGWAALTLVPWWLGRRGPARAVLSGQLVAIRARAYDAAGGFAAVRDSLAEDAALGRRLAARGHRLAVVDGAGLVRCRPYDQLGELWEGNVRNLAAVLYGSPLLAIGGALALVLLHTGPLLLLLAAAVGDGQGLAWPLAALGLALLPRWFADRRAGHRLGVTLLHPLAMVALGAMMIASWWRVRSGGSVEWCGRRYRASDRAA